MPEIIRSKVLEFFLEDSPKVVVCEVLVIVCVDLGCYIFFEIFLRGILGIDSIPKSGDFLSLFGVYVDGLGDKVLNRVKRGYKIKLQLSRSKLYSSSCCVLICTSIAYFLIYTSTNQCRFTNPTVSTGTKCHV